MNISAEPFYQLPKMDWTEKLLANEAEICNELLSHLKEDFTPKKPEEWASTYSHYSQTESNEKKPWKTFDLQFFGIKHLENCAKFPFTSRLLSEIPELITAHFSLLHPKTIVQPHVGYSKMLLRNHLPLIVPEKGDMGIKVKDEVRCWKKGELLSFNDGFIHEAWNLSDEIRVVLLFDVAHPQCGYSAKEICAYKINNLEDDFLLGIADKNTWRKWLHQGFFSMD